MSLKINNLHVSVENKEIIKGVTLEVAPGKIVALMGPNGSGKSTISFALMGHPKYHVTKGEVTINGKNLLDMPVEERAKAGLFLSFQYPREIVGVTVSNFLRTALNHFRTKPIGVMEFHELLDKKMKLLKMDSVFKDRYLNQGFSGGEKKRMEILQMALLQPKYAILDETDSGLDIDSMRIVAEGVNSIHNNEMGILVITHYQRLLNYIKPEIVHVLNKGRIIKTGDEKLVHVLEKEGYDTLIKESNKVKVKII